MIHTWATGSPWNPEIVSNIVNMHLHICCPLGEYPQMLSNTELQSGLKNLVFILRLIWPLNNFALKIHESPLDVAVPAQVLTLWVVSIMQIVCAHLTPGPSLEAEIVLSSHRGGQGGTVGLRDVSLSCGESPGSWPPCFGFLGCCSFYYHPLWRVSHHQNHLMNKAQDLGSKH